jgi:hypothetical protein
VIADCQLPILDWRLPIEPIGNRQSQIENLETHPLPRGGTDFIGSRVVNLSPLPLKTRSRGWPKPNTK